MLARARKRMRRDSWLNVHAHDRLVEVHTNSGRRGDGVTLCRCVYEHARATTREAVVRSGRSTEERESTPHATRFCASSSSAPHKAHICVIVPAGSIRPMLVRRTRSYPTVRLKSTRVMPRFFSESPRSAIPRTSARLTRHVAV